MLHLARSRITNVSVPWLPKVVSVRVHKAYIRRSRKLILGRCLLCPALTSSSLECQNISPPPGSCIEPPPPLVSPRYTADELPGAGVAPNAFICNSFRSPLVSTMCSVNASLNSGKLRQHKGDHRAKVPNIGSYYMFTKMLFRAVLQGRGSSCCASLAKGKKGSPSCRAQDVDHQRAFARSQLNQTHSWGAVHFLPASDAPYANHLSESLNDVVKVYSGR